MAVRKTLKIIFLSLVGIALASALGFGIAFGAAIASTRNIMSVENFEDFSPSLPSKILDIQGRVITEFASDEKRTLVSIKELPQHLIDAVLTREDETFWTHPGFTLKGYVRAFLGIVLNKNLGGGSTITLQLAGSLYADRREISFRRKAIELWWALQLERRFTKQEILEEYLNRVNMGPGVYGVEAASQYYFGHSAREATLAESAILALTFSAPSKYNPIRNPYVVQDRSRYVLDQMVEKGFASKEDADESFALYWDNLDYTRTSTAAYYSREDKAPWFSDYVRQQLEQMLYGNIDLYADGLTVHTTLNLDYQAVADRYMNRYIEQANKSYLASSSRRLDAAGKLYAPMSELLGLGFNLEGMFFQSSRLDAK
ncbi:MAG TPA: transglycosylase domain-containing protein, partial [Spirochaetales bacterium]|nr:transglycosylase domain-containing protein [Spirochaetales bacterium]